MRKTMKNEKNKSVEMTSHAGETVAENDASYRPWHKPSVKRICIKRTLAGPDSRVDAFAFST